MANMTKLAARAPRAWLISVALPLGLAACAPALDWREVRPDDSPVLLMLPCKPSILARNVPLAGQTVKLTLHACSAGGQTWALAQADVADPARVTTALQALQATALANLGVANATAANTLALNVPGATPNVAAARVAAQGQLSDGTRVQEQVAVFSFGTRVFQATVVGQRLSAEAVETFFGALRLRA